MTFWEAFWVACMAVCAMLMLASRGQPKSGEAMMMQLTCLTAGMLGYLVGAVGYVIAHGPKPPPW